MEEMSNKITRFKEILKQSNLAVEVKESIKDKIKALESKIHILK